MFTAFGGASSSTACSLQLNNNPYLTNVLFPTPTGTTRYFRNFENSELRAAFSLYSSDLGYVDFKPFSAATLISGATQGLPRIALHNNNMTASEVNHILVDFSGITVSNPTGWSNVNLNIGGTNADPDSSSGGYDGLSAISTLTGSPYNWTITY
jgi:hypothetical protein